MADEVVVGATKKPLDVTIVDDKDDPLPLTGGSARLQGSSNDIGTTIDQALTLTDPAQGRVGYVGLGALITTQNMNGKKQALFDCRIKYTDAAGLIDWTPVFQLLYKTPPVAA